MSFIGNTPTSQSFISGTDYFNGTGSQTAFTLTRAVNSVNDIEVVINNVVQRPNTAYTILGNVVTFTSAPSAGTANIYVRYLSTSTQTITPSAGTVGWNQLTADVQQDLGISFKNRIINGDMRFDQRNAGASKVFDASSIYHLDQWRLRYNGGAGLATATAQQSTNAPAGFKNSFLITVGTAKTPVAGNRFGLEQPIEGYNVADLGWGTINAKTITVSFWVKSSLTGPFGAVVGNLNDRAYSVLYTINAANTWEYKTVTIPGCTDGTWASGNTAGIYLFFDIGQGSDVRAAPGAWNVGSILGTTGGTNLVATAGATWQLTGVQLEAGSTATAFDFRSYGTELALCQRYHQQLPSGAGTLIGQGWFWTNTVIDVIIPHKVTMRSAPTLVQTTGTNYFALQALGQAFQFSGWTSIDTTTTDQTTLYVTGTGSGTIGTTGYVYMVNASARLALTSEL